MPTAPTPIVNIPTPVPTTADPTSFDARADATFAGLPVTVDGINDTADVTYDNAVEAAASAVTAEEFAGQIEAAAAVAITATEWATTSPTMLLIGAGAKTFVVDDAGVAFAVEDQLLLVSRSSNLNQLSGEVTGRAGTSITIMVPGDGFTGAGSPNDWIVMSAAFIRKAAVAADVLAMISTLLAITPKSIRDALIPFALVDGATVTPNGLSGLDFTWTIGGNRILAAIINTYPGASGTITITQDGTGTRILAWASGVYRRRGGLPVLSTAAGSVDELEYKVRTVDGGGTATRITVSLIKAPTG